MFRLVQKWEESGLPLKTFSNTVDVSYYKMKYWKYKFDKLKQENTVSNKTEIENEVVVSNAPDKQDFIPVEFPVPANNSGFELSFPNGVKLTWKQGIDTEELKTLIKLF